MDFYQRTWTVTWQSLLDSRDAVFARQNELRRQWARGERSPALSQELTKCNELHTRLTMAIKGLEGSVS